MVLYLKLLSIESNVYINKLKKKALAHSFEEKRQVKIRKKRLSIYEYFFMLTEPIYVIVKDFSQKCILVFCFKLFLFLIAKTLSS